MADLPADVARDMVSASWTNRCVELGTTSSVCLNYALVLVPISISIIDECVATFVEVLVFDF